MVRGIGKFGKIIKKIRKTTTAFVSVTGFRCAYKKKRSCKTNDINTKCIFYLKLYISIFTA